MALPLLKILVVGENVQVKDKVNGRGACRGVLPVATRTHAQPVGKLDISPTHVMMDSGEGRTSPPGPRPADL